MRTSTLEMEVKLMEYFKYRTNYVVPGLTKSSGLVRFETDILSVTKRGYASGVEIKVSKSDLKNDLKKKHWKSYVKMPDDVNTRKYFGRLKYFYYAVPTDLIEDVEKQVPDWCGILVLGKYGRIRQYRMARRLYNYKWSETEILDLLRIGVMRIHSLKRRELRKTK